jgi:maltose O-acetyltransferase
MATRRSSHVATTGRDSAERDGVNGVNGVVGEIGEAESSHGHPIVFNEGEIQFGNNVSISTLGEPVTLMAKPGAVIVLGDDVAVGSGSTIAAFGRVEVGSDTQIGARCRLLDDDSGAGIRVGDRVLIEDDVMIVAGAVIGADARILKGSLVVGRVSDGAVVRPSADPIFFQPTGAAGARSSKSATPADTAQDAPLLQEVRATVSTILPSAAVAAAGAVLEDWDSLTTVHLIVALEERFGVMIDDGALIDRRTLQSLTDYVEEQRAATAGVRSSQSKRLSRPNVVVAQAASDATQQAPATDAHPEPIRPAGRRSEGISLEIKAFGGAFSKSNLCIKLANLLPIWSLRHLRWYLLRAAGCRLAPKCTFLGQARFVGPSPSNLEVAEGAIIGPKTTFGVDGKITIGRNVSVGPGVTIYTGTHDVGPAHRRMDLRVLAKPVTIEDGAWIGLNALILPGVRIGAGAIVSAGAVVSVDVPSNTVVAGNPAVVVRTIVA